MTIDCGVFRLTKAISNAALAAVLTGCAGTGGGRLFAASDGKPVVLAQGGSTEYVIACGEAPTEAEAYAAQELATFLKKVTGAGFAVVKEGAAPPSGPRIYIGWTDFASRHTADGARLGDEEWVVRTVGPDLVITGGRPRGTLYGVYAFLEREIGCHWLDQDTEVVPRLPDLRIGRLDRRGQPAFWFRSLYTVFEADRALLATWSARNMANSPGTGGLGPRHGFQVGYGTPGGCHTFAAYAKNFPADRPEYLSMNSRGERVGATSGSGPGGICLTHPDVRKLVLANLRGFIARDRAAAVKDKRPPPRVYDISQNDNHWMCQCPECKTVSEREGSESGPLVDFINEIADGIRPEYPDVYVMTFAYSITEKPPRTLKPRDNVIIRIAELNAEWGRDSDLFHPITHPANRTQFERLQGWSRITKNIAAWDYWIQYSPNDKFPTPYAPVVCLQPDLETFHRHGVSNVFVECESPETTSFFALKCWLGYQLMQDPYQPVEPLIETFVTGYYGPAAGKMREYLAFMQDSIAAVDENMSAMKCYARPYLTLDFYARCEQLLAEAEALAVSDPKALLHVRRERIPVDAGLYYMWPELTRERPAGQALPFAAGREGLIDRYEGYRLEQIAAVRPQAGQGKGRSAVGKEVQAMRDVLVIEQRRKRPPYQVRVPKAAQGTALGDPAKVDWAKGVELSPWYRTSGADTDQKLTGRVLHDGRFLYVRLEHVCDPGQLTSGDQIWDGDDWELFFAATRGVPPYRQLAVNPAGKTIAYDWENLIGKCKPTDWESGARAVSEPRGDRWRLSVSIPLAALVPGGVGSGGTVYANVYRAVKEPKLFLAWSPTFEEGFHFLTRLPELTLE